MAIRFGNSFRLLSSALLAFTIALPAMVSTLSQNVSWTVNRSDSTAKHRVVADGESSYAGYNGSVSNAARYAAPTVESEYLSAAW